MSAHNLADLVPFVHAPALVDRCAAGRRMWTGVEFSARVRAIGGALTARLRFGAAVLVVGGVSSQALGAFLGAAAAGMTAVPLNTRLPPATVRVICQDASIQLALVERGYEQFVPQGVPTMLIEHAMRCEAPVQLYVAAEHLLALMYRSGSIGVPEAVPITHGGYLRAVRGCAALRPSIEHRTALVAEPLFHIDGQFHALSMLFYGARVVLLDAATANTFLDALAERDVWRVTSEPSMFEQAARRADSQAPGDFHHVGMVAMGSAPLGEALRDRVQRLFPNAVVARCSELTGRTFCVR